MAHPPAARHEVRFVCTPGLEPVVAEELRGLGVHPGPLGRGGVAVLARTRELYLATASLRTVSRVLVTIGRFRASGFAELQRGVRGLGADAWLAPSSAVRIRASAHRSRLYHTGAVAERVAEALDRTPVGPSAGHEDEDETGTGVPLVVVRIVGDEVVVRVDAAGAPLDRRGWRLEAARAPLRETLAAAALQAVGWDGTVPLLDPFAGSGTIPIEAALRARGVAAGLHRPFAFQCWPAFEPGTWASVEAELRARHRPDRPLAIAASDRDQGAVEAARANGERAGVGDAIVLRRSAISDVVPPPGADRPGWIVTNPPWGGRLRGGRSADLRDLYARFGAVARERFAGWGVAVLAGGSAPVGHAGLRLEERFRTSSGGTPVRLLVQRPRTTADRRRQRPPAAR